MFVTAEEVPRQAAELSSENWLEAARANAYR